MYRLKVPVVGANQSVLAGKLTVRPSFWAGLSAASTIVLFENHGPSTGAIIPRLAIVGFSVIAIAALHLVGHGGVAGSPDWIDVAHSHIRARRGSTRIGCNPCVTGAARECEIAP